MADQSLFPRSNGSSSNGRTQTLAPNGQAPNTAATDGSAYLRALLGMMWDGKWIILGVFAVVVAAAAGYTYSIAPTYSTSSLLLVNQDEGDMMFGRRSMSQLYGSQGRNLSNEILILNRSGTIAQRVAERIDTMRVYPRTGQRISLLYTANGNRRPVRQIARIVQGSVGASRAGSEIDAIRISARSTVPADAALMANLYAEEYIARTREKSRESLLAKQSFLEKQAEKFREDVEQSEARIEQYMRQQGAVALDQETSRVVDQLSTLESRRDELRIELDMERAALETQRDELEDMRPKLAERLSSGLDEELNRVQKERAEIQARLDRIKQVNPSLSPNDDTPQAREYARLQRRYERLEAQADSLAQQYVERTLEAGGVGSSADEGQRGLSYVVEQQKKIAQQRIKVNGLEAQLATVNERIAEYERRMRNLPSQSLELAQLQRERRSAEQIYGFVREKLQETRMAMESEVGYAEIIDPAGIPGSPVSPNTRRNMMLASILGLLLGGGLVLLRERLDTRIRTPGDLRNLGHRVIGVIPSMQPLIDEQFGGQKTIEIDGQSVNTSLVMLSSPMSASAESYRRLRANLRFARPDTEIRSLVVTSSEKGEGKTTTASNLAAAMASAGRRTVLVDADLRRPRTHKFFHISQSPGLTEALYDSAVDLDDFSTDIDNLSILPAGGDVPNPAELLGSARMSSFISRLEDAFDVVLIDSPPLLLFSDPLTLVPHTDGALLVTSAGKTDGRAFSHAVDLLSDVEGGLVGAVLNRYEPSSRPGYGYRYSYGSYAYGNYGYRHGVRQLEDYYDENRSRSSSSSSSFLKFWER